MEDGDWVLVRQPAEKDLWTPSLVKEEERSKPLKVTFGGPAKFWTDAIPIGNGRLGAMVWGGVASETLQLNECECKSILCANQMIYVGCNAWCFAFIKLGPALRFPIVISGVLLGFLYPGSSEILGVGPRIESGFSSSYFVIENILVVSIHFEDTLWTGTPGNYTNANAPQALTEVYQLLGDINLEFDDLHLKYAEETYSRELDLDTAIARIKYSVGEVEYTREHFASNPDQVIVTKISASKSGSLSFTVSLDSKLHHGSHISGDKGVIHSLDDKKFRVEEADWAILLLVASSSFEDPFTKPSDSKRNPTSESLAALTSIKRISYFDLYARHLDDYQNLFHRVSLQLSKSSKSIFGNKTMEMKKCNTITSLNFKGNDNSLGSTADRVKTFKIDEDPSFVELLF
ncbi:hypothetical protein ACLB2K_020817 [Fragaria x ananassa]